MQTPPLEESEEKAKIQSFLGKLKWKQVRQQGLQARLEEQQGITWLELYALYEQHGGRPTMPDARRIEQLAAKGEGATSEEQKDLDYSDFAIATEKDNVKT